MVPSPRDVKATLTDGVKKSKVKKEKATKKDTDREEEKKAFDDLPPLDFEEAGGESHRHVRKKKSKKGGSAQEARVESSLVNKEQIRRLLARSKHSRKKVSA